MKQSKSTSTCIEIRYGNPCIKCMYNKTRINKARRENHIKSMIKDASSKSKKLKNPADNQLTFWVFENTKKNRKKPNETLANKYHV